MLANHFIHNARCDTILLLEFKKTASPDKKTVGHFRLLEKLNLPIGSGGVICLTRHYLPLTPTVSSIPVSVI